MAALDFPASPTVNQQFSAPNGAVYTWDGAVWMGGGPYAGQPAGGDLSGTYPSPTVIPAARSKWTDTGATLTPNASTRQIVVPGPTASSVDQSQLVLGTRTQKGHLYALSGYDQIGLTKNLYFDGSAWRSDDATQPSWLACFEQNDNFEIRRAAAGNPATVNEVFGIHSDLKTYCTLADRSVTRSMIAVNATGNNTVGVQGPANWSYPGPAATWIKHFDIGTLTTRGGHVMIAYSPGLRYVGNNNGTDFYIAFGRNNGVVLANKFTFSGSGTGLSVWMVPGFVFFDWAPAAGNNLYSIYVWMNPTSNGTLQTLADSPGTGYAIEFA